VIFGDHTKCFKYVGFPFAPGADGIKVLKPRDPINEKFAYYACLSLRLPDRGYSRHYSFLKRSRFPLAPRGEQLRIVNKIEELFSGLDKSIESLKTAREQLKVYRQAVLKHAFEGKLSAGWRQAYKRTLKSQDHLRGLIQTERDARYQEQSHNWQKAVQCPESSGKKDTKLAKPRRLDTLHVNSVSRRDLPDGWGWELLGNLNTDVFDGPFGSSLKTSDYVDDGVRVIRLENIGSLRFIDDKVSYISEEKYELLKKHTVRAGDIIVASFVIDGIRLAILPETIDRAVNKADCFCLRLHGESVRADYVAKLFVDESCLQAA
jgi:type I restriction enzyme S subunit